LENTIHGPEARLSRRLVDIRRAREARGCLDG
jgi:hypothetical protein